MRSVADKEQNIERWLHFAEADMVSAEVLHGADQELNAIFHLQQAVEKTLKAFLLKRTALEPPRIHGLRKLTELCALDLTEEQNLLLQNLSQYYVESRYPGDWLQTPSHLISTEVERLIPAAKGFIRWLRSQI